MDKKQLIEKFDEVYEQLYLAIVDYQRVSENAIAKNAELKEKTAKLYADGEVIGKNQNERDGWLADHLKTEISNVNMAEHDERNTKMKLEIARTRVSHAQAVLRIYELTSIS